MSFLVEIRVPSSILRAMTKNNINRLIVWSRLSGDKNPANCHRIHKEGEDKHEIKNGVVDEGSLPNSGGIKGSNSILDTIVEGAIEKLTSSPERKYAQARAARFHVRLRRKWKGDTGLCSFEI